MNAVARRERERVADQRPGDRRHRQRGDAHHERVQRVLGAHQAGVEEPERRRHQQHQRGGGEHPGGVARVDSGRHQAPTGVTATLSVSPVRMRTTCSSVEHEDLAVADLAGPAAVAERVDRRLDELVGHRDLEADLLRQPDPHRRAAVGLDPVELTAVALHAAHREAPHLGAVQGLEHLVRLLGTDDPDNELHLRCSQLWTDSPPGSLSARARERLYPRVRNRRPISCPARPTVIRRIPRSPRVRQTARCSAAALLAAVIVLLAPAAAQADDVRVYFTQGRAARLVQRDLRHGPDRRAEGAARRPDGGRAKKGYGTAIPTGSTLTSAKVDGEPRRRSCSADRSRRTSPSYSARLAQVVYTATAADAASTRSQIAGQDRTRARTSGPSRTRSPSRRPRKLPRPPTRRRSRPSWSRSATCPTGAVTGTLDYRTQQAVLAFQAWSGPRARRRRRADDAGQARHRRAPAGDRPRPRPAASRSTARAASCC